MSLIERAIERLQAGRALPLDMAAQLLAEGIDIEALEETYG
jgi:hypothetical protein